MPIDITNAGYLAQAVKNRPVIGWHSIVDPSGFIAAGSDSENLWSPDTYTFWTSAVFASLEDPTIAIQIQDGDSVNYGFIVGHNAGDYSADVVAEYSDDGSSWTEISRVTAEDNSPIIFYFNEVGNDFFRIRFDVDFNTVDDADFIVVAHARIGTALILERPAFVGTSPFNRQIEKLTNRSDSGKYLGSTLVSEVRRYSIDQENNSDSFSREFIEPFLKHCELIGNDSAGPKGSFFYAWRPEEFPEDVYYCGDPESVTWPNYSRPNKAVGVSWSISGVAER